KGTQDLGTIAIQERSRAVAQVTPFQDYQAARMAIFGRYTEPAAQPVGYLSNAQRQCSNSCYPCSIIAGIAPAFGRRDR
ncbi:hypothetical protein ABTC31_19925, partial [Acinetobacter baumannii]